jgi:hypothetical protein
VLEEDLKPEFLPAPKRGTFLADSFGLVYQGKQVILAEEWPKAGIGHISAIQLDETCISKETVIKIPTHLSYPYLVQHQGEIYCIPESHKTRNVTIFRAMDFPSKWEEAKTIITNFAAVDSTVFQYNGYWWLMCTNKDTDSNSALYIWYTKDLLGPWEEHKANPVKTDVGSSRPGGTPFIVNGELFRPAQNSTITYGGSLVINKIKKLTIDEFQEEIVKEIGPYENGPYSKGIHTLASLGNQTLVDGKRRIFFPRFMR